MNRKQLIFWVVLIFVNLCVLEIGLSIFYFQRKSEYPFAILYYWRQAGRVAYNFFNWEPIGIWDRDPKFGFSHVANSRGTHRTADFEVTYTIGADKERFIPAPAKPVGRILFLGDSFTFGHGVADAKVYPYVLSQKYWPNWHVVNKAVMGWGTAHAYMVLREEIERANPPAVIIYAMIPHDITRNYIRSSWVRALAKYNRGQPHFELVHGKLQFQGVSNVANDKPDSPELWKKEIELTAAFLVNMKNKSAAKQIPFIVILLPTRWPDSDRWPLLIIKTLVENNIPILDASEIKLQGFQIDPHPNESDHERIAEAIARSFIAKMLECLQQEGESTTPTKSHGTDVDSGTLQPGFTRCA